MKENEQVQTFIRRLKEEYEIDLDFRRVKKRETTLTTNYRRQWGLWEAIREIVQNTLDETEQLPDISQKDNTLIIRDNGCGMSLTQFFLLGVSEKEGENKRGQYGEGLKIALVILKRLGYDILIRSRDWISTVESENFGGYKVINYVYGDGLNPIRGVEIRIGGLNKKDIDEFMEHRFLPINHQKDIIVKSNFTGEILKGEKYGGKLYQRGIWVQDIKEGSLYGYDLYQVKLGTDRQFADEFSIKFSLGRLLSLITDHIEIRKVIRQFQKDSFEAKASYMELNESYKEVFYDMYGSNAVPGYDSDLRGKVTHRGGRFIKFQTPQIIQAFKNCGIKDAIQFIRDEDDKIRKEKRRKFEELSKPQKRMVERAFEVIEETRLFRSTLKRMVEEGTIEFIPAKYVKIGGYQEGNKIGISIKVLKDLPDLIEKIGHELIHLEKGWGDATAQFQAELDEFCRTVIKILLNERNKGVTFEAKIINQPNGGRTINIPKKFENKINSGYKKIKIKELWE